MSSLAEKIASSWNIVPQVIDKKNKWLVGTVAILFTSVVYFIPNHMKIIEPVQLQMLWLDREVQLIPWTIWIYISDYFMVLFAFFWVRELENQNRFLYSYIIIQVVAVTFFVLFPTIYPRAAHPLPAGDEITLWVFEFIRWVDHPSNCFPSLHVATCFISAFAFRLENRIKYWAFLIWAVAVCASTLTTKQHYVMDIIGGFTLAVFSSWIAQTKLKITMRD